MTVEIYKSNQLQNFPVQLEIPVAWGEMDSFAHVNNLVYLRWFESARMAYMERSQALRIMQRDGIGPILRDSSIRYRIPLTWPDQIISATRVTRLEKDRFTMEHKIYSQSHGAIAAEGEAVIVCVDYQQNCKTAIPASVRDFILNHEPQTPIIIE
ncbi:MAG: acyl-CoA thioesterase [Marinobacterium sp.]|nr:acyl-CoA thioesterase [Marinobacterium sp.]